MSCIDGYFLQGTECILCNKGCKTCRDSGEDCEYCTEGYWLDGTTCKKCGPLCKNCHSTDVCIDCGLDPANQIGHPTCYCKHGMSPWYEGNKCIVCTPPCLECTGPSGDGECLSCIDPYYLSGTSCLKCFEGCTQCTTSPENCQSCIDGYFLEGTECKECVSPCKRCLSLTHCLECGYGEELREGIPDC